MKLKNEVIKLFHILGKRCLKKKNILMLFSVSILFTSNVYCSDAFTGIGDSIKCNINSVVILSNSINSPDDDSILNFLLSFDESCENNVEFIEFSNEVLFDILKHCPDKVLNLLTYDEVDTNLILDVLKSPIHDGININQLIDVIKKEKETLLQKQVLLSLQEAL